MPSPLWCTGELMVEIRKRLISMAVTVITSNDPYTTDVKLDSLDVPRKFTQLDHHE